MYTDFDKRMKRYELASKQFLTQRTPVIIRIDGKNFHTFTKGFDEPFDNIFLSAMRDTMKYLCENIEGCVFGYTQSDEITLVLVDYQTIKTQSWFGYNVQKLCSVTAGMTTMMFNETMFRIVANNFDTYLMNTPYFVEKNICGYRGIKTGVFDARCFNIPKEDVCNNLIWRQKDCIRNSISRVAHSYFSNKELYKKTQSEMEEMLLKNAGINWNDYPVDLKYGVCCYREECDVVNKDDGAIIKRNKYIIDEHPPVFSEQRDYVNKHIYV
ncbi:MAG: tRNA(His) guanylyltransferase Thg1 family protein [Anaerostipes sp.]|uniref:tRNA(His) guanylyltransferase Thg1 family protein n=1 Tax=Anaerostipes sp. TaxID=1872530 RepID=UPI00399377A9